MSRASAHPDLQDALKHEYARAPSILIPDSVRALLPHLARPVPVNSSLWHDWRQAVADSMFFACKTVLSNVPPHLDKLTWRTHGILCALAQDESLLEVVYEYPRKTLKSSVVTVRKPWHRFIRAVVEGRDPSDRYFVLSHGKEKAKRHWWDQKALFDGDGPNQRFFRFLFPELRPSRKSELSTKNEKWNENIGFLERDWNRKNGSFEPLGSREAGAHFDGGAADDLIEEENYDEPTAVDKAILYYEFTQNWLEGEHSWLDIVGNRWGLADLNSHLHKTREGTNRVILSVSLETGARRNCEFGCYNLPPYAEELCDILDHTASQFGTIWPEGLPTSYIKSSLRGKLRPSVYSAQYLNFPEDADAVEFPISQVHRVKQISLASPIGTALDRGTSHLPVPLHSLNLFVTLDPALDGPSSKNSSAIIVSGMDSSRNVYAIREWVKTRASYTVVLDKFLAFLRLYAGLVHSAGIEEVLFQRVLKDLLRQRASERNIYAPLRPIKTPTSKTKDQRIRAALGTIIEQGRLWVSHDCPQLYDQIRTFGVPGAPRDAIDSLAIAAQIWVPPLSDDETSQIIESDTLAEVERGDTGYGYDLLIS